MYCPKCGKKIRDGIKFCDACGSEIEEDKKEMLAKRSESRKMKILAFVGFGIALESLVVLALAILYHLDNREDPIFYLLLAVFSGIAAIGVSIPGLKSKKKGFAITGIIIGSIVAIAGTAYGFAFMM